MLQAGSHAGSRHCLGYQYNSPASTFGEGNQPCTSQESRLKIYHCKVGVGAGMSTSTMSATIMSIFIFSFKIVHHIFHLTYEHKNY